MRDFFETEVGNWIGIILLFGIIVVGHFYNKIIEWGRGRIAALPLDGKVEELRGYTSLR
jgi:hypothetical protein